LAYNDPAYLQARAAPLPQAGATILLDDVHHLHDAQELLVWLSAQLQKKRSLQGFQVCASFFERSRNYDSEIGFGWSGASCVQNVSVIWGVWSAELVIVSLHHSNLGRAARTNSISSASRPSLKQ
jgi:hypothetical protein